MQYQFYNQLPKEAQEIRQKVFVEEQGFENEFDERDHDCFHFVLFNNHQQIGCARMYEENQAMVLGRIAILKEYRHHHYGTCILQCLENKAKEMHFSQVVLSAQVRASEFYKKNGYIPFGQEYLDEYCPHIHMKKEL